MCAHASMSWWYRALNGIRIHDLLIRNQMLYPLSYQDKKRRAGLDFTCNERGNGNIVCILLVHTASSVINRLIKPPRAIHIPFPDVGSAIAITVCSDQPTCDRALDRNCTCDPELRRFLLYLLSYKGGILSSMFTLVFMCPSTWQ